MPFLRLCAVLLVPVFLIIGCNRKPTSDSPQEGSASNSKPPQATVELSPDQLRSIKIEPLGTYRFSVEKEGIGNIDFDNKLYFNSDLSISVFPSHGGTVSKIYVELGDNVQKNQPLYAIESQGRSEDVLSPIAGQVTSLNAPIGLGVEPGQAPAPCTVASVETKWMLGNVSEMDSPEIHAGQPVTVKVATYPNRVFEGSVSRVYAMIDPNTHRVQIRCDIADPQNELRSGMLASFSVRVQDGVESSAVPANGVVHEPDGSMTAWVTTDRRHFVQKVIKVGLQMDGMDQVLEGLQPGDLVVTDGAVFLSNILEALPSD